MEPGWPGIPDTTPTERVSSKSTTSSGGQGRSSKPDTLILTGPHEFHSIIPDPELIQKQQISYYAILFYLEEGEEVLERILTQALRERRNPVQLDVKYHFLFEIIMERWGRSSECQKQAALHQFLGFLYMIYGDTGETPHPPHTGWIHVRKALDLMSRGVHGKITVEEIARKVGISEEYLIRLFQQHLRITPLQYANRLRIEAAAGKLIGSTHSISQIAEQFWFENQFHFSRVFKKCTGLSPSQYRKYYIFPWANPMIWRTELYPSRIRYS